MSPKSQVLWFTGLVLAVSWLYEAFLITHNGVSRFGLAGLVALMWIPGLLCLAFRALAQLGFQDLGLRAGRAVFYFWAIGIPFGLALFTNMLSVPLGMKSYGLIPPDALRRHALLVLISLVAGLFGALGEELGWRGFLLPKLVAAKFPRPLLLSGIIWALWHAPLVSLGGYYTVDAPLLIGLTYSFSIVAMGFVVGLLRLRSGSVWVATIFHAAHNFFFQLAVPHLLITGSGPNAKWWELIGADCGLIVGLLYLLAAGLLWWFPDNRAPGA